MDNFGELVVVSVKRSRNSIIITWNTKDGRKFVGTVGFNVEKGNNVLSFNLITVLRMIVEKCTDVANKTSKAVKTVGFYLNIPVINWKGFMDEIESKKDTDLFYIIQLTPTLGLSEDTATHCKAQQITEKEYKNSQNKLSSLSTLGKRIRH